MPLNPTDALWDTCRDHTLSRKLRPLHSLLDFYSINQVGAVVAAFKGKGNQRFVTPGHLLTYSYEQGPGIGTHLVVITSKQTCFGATMGTLDALNDWTWPRRPTDADEYSAMMASLDRLLAASSTPMHQRPTQAAIAVCRVLELGYDPRWRGDVDRGEPFSARDLGPRAFDWYRSNYGERINFDPSPGSAVLALHGNYWRLRMPFVRGPIDFFMSRDLNTGDSDAIAINRHTRINALTAVDGLTQTYANRLTDTDLNYIEDEFHRGLFAINILDALRGHDLFDQARGDYHQSVDALLKGTTLSKARWDNAQATEKIFKGLLGRAGHKYPTSGPKGHDIVHLGALITQYFGVSLPKGSLDGIACPPSVRYAEINVDQNEAYTSHKELLATLLRISSSGLVSK